jgi:hypothetical protein
MTLKDVSDSPQLVSSPPFLGDPEKRSDAPVSEHALMIRSFFPDLGVLPKHGLLHIRVGRGLSVTKSEIWSLHKCLRNDLRETGKLSNSL